jgi:lipoprotein LprG
MLPLQPVRAASRPLRLVVLALVAALALTACGGSDGGKKAAAKTPAQVMASAKKHFDDASSVHIKLSTDSTPPAGSNGVLGASGDITHEPAFEGDVKVLLSGLTATVPVTSVGGKVYAKLPLQTGYSTINPDEYGAPDPADFADPDKGLSSLLTQLDGLEKGKQTRSGGEILTSYTGTLPGSAVKAIIPSASAKKTYQTEVGVDEKGFATTVKITGIFFSAGDDVTYDVLLTGYGKGVEITAPKA